MKRRSIVASYKFFPSTILQSLTKFEKSIQLMHGYIDVEIRLMKMEFSSLTCFRRICTQAS